MTLEERPEGRKGKESLDAPPRAERDLVDDLNARIAELDAIAWNLPRSQDEVGPATDPSDVEPAA